MSSKTGQSATIIQRVSSLSAGVLAALALLLVGRGSYAQEVPQAQLGNDPSSAGLKPVSTDQIGYMDVSALGEQWGEGKWGDGPPQGPRPE
jgi:hypothetical protein